MAAKSAKTKTKKANKPVKKTVKSVIKKVNNKVTKKSKKSINKSKPKVKASSKKNSTKIKLKPKHKSNIGRASALKKKNVITTTKSAKFHMDSKTEKKLSNKKHSADKISVDTPNFSFEPHAVVDNEADSTEKNSNLFVTTNPQNDTLLSGPSGKFTPYQAHSTEEYMNEQQLQHFTKILNDWKQELMMEVDHTISEMKDADVLADLNDRATQEEAFNLELRARDRERKLIKKIEMALNKIKHHEYGYCDTCGVEIGVRRLEARPTATLCIECKTLAEIREKRV